MGILDVKKIKELRDRRGISQGEAAKLAGMSAYSRWSEIENGRTVNVTLDTLEGIARALGVKPRSLLKK